MVDVLIKTFLRDEYLEKCVESCMETYPDYNIYIADDGYVTPEKLEQYKKWRKEGVKIWLLPFDCGLPYGRNFLTDKITSKYVLIGDDDFEYVDSARVDGMVQILEHEPDIDIVGGRITEGGITKDYQGLIDYKKDKIVVSPVIENKFKQVGIMRYKEVDLTFNYILIRREVFKKIKWDEKIKVAYEHFDFFLQAKLAGLKVAYTPEAVVVHKPVSVKPTNKYQYKWFRYRKTDKDHFWNKWKLKSFTDINGANFDKYNW